MITARGEEGIEVITTSQNPPLLRWDTGPARRALLLHWDTDPAIELFLIDQFPHSTREGVDWQC
jgi:hypothetical protein